MVAYFYFSYTLQESDLLTCNIHFRCVEQINKASRGDLTPEELKERQVDTLDKTFITETISIGYIFFLSLLFNPFICP